MKRYTGHIRPQTSKAQIEQITVMLLLLRYAQSLRTIIAAYSLVRDVSPCDLPPSESGPPRVDEIIPADGAKEIMVTMPVIVTFSEVVDPATVNGNTFQLLDMGPAGSQTIGTGAPVLAGIYTSIEGGRMRATLQPRTNMLYGNVYKVVLTNGITDYATDNADGTTKGLENPMTVTFITKVPQVYDLPSDSQFQPSGASDIALYTAANGRTFAYIASGVSGFRVADVTDPTNPYITYDSTQIEHFTSLTKAYRGVAVDQASGILAVTDLITYTLEGSAQATQSNFNAIGNVRFFDLNDHPDNPGYMIGHDRLTENYSGVPGKLAVSGNYAYVSTAMVGLQVVDIAASKSVSSSNPGAAIVGAYDTLGGGFLQPLDIKLYKGGHAVLTTSSGNLLVLDVNVPEIPQLIKAYKPAGYSAYRADVASEYAWTDNDGNTQVMDVAVTSSGDGKVHTVDLTDPYNIMHYGPVKNTDGTDLLCFASDITISRTSGLVYIAGSGAVYVIDIKDPKNPKLLNVIAQTPLSPGSTVMDSLGYATALVEKDGWVYLANMQKGMRVLDLDPQELKIEDPDPDFTDVALRPTDYYPALGTKAVIIEGEISGVPFNITNTAEWGLYLISNSTNSITVSRVDNNVCQPTPLSPEQLINPFTYDQIHNRSIVPVCIKWNNPASTDYPSTFTISLQARKIGTSQAVPGATATDKYNFTFHILHNGIVDIAHKKEHVSLEDVLVGQAVFVADGLISTSTGTFESTLGFDYVKELLNQVVPRKRSLVFNTANTNAPNVTPIPATHGLYVADEKKYPYNSGNTSTALLDEDGIFEKINTSPTTTSPTSQALEIFRRNFGLGNTKYNSPEDNDASRTMKKILKDYGRGLTIDQKAKLLYQVVDKETLIGTTRLIAAPTEAVTTTNSDVLINGASGNGRNDTGLYELYRNAVERFVNKMISEAELYAGERQPASGEQAVTDNWFARTGAGLGEHGDHVGMSYCFGCKNDIREFNTAVSPSCRADESQSRTGYYTLNNNGTFSSHNASKIATQPRINRNYTGNLVTGATCTLGGAFKYPGLYEWEWRARLSSSPTYTTQNLQSLMTHWTTFEPSNWAGIDCSGLVSRAMQASQQQFVSGGNAYIINLARISNGTSGSTPVEFYTNAARENWGSGTYFRFANNATTTYDETKINIHPYYNEQPMVHYLSDTSVNTVRKLHKGDIVKYSGHIATIYSFDKQNCNASTCSYEIIHASGSDCLDINRNGKCESNEPFNRKVVINSTQLFRTVPTGYGRIKLWD